MTSIDWSQFVPDILAGIVVALILAIVGVVIAYFRSEKFKNWLNKLFNKASFALKWFIGKWRFILLFCVVTVLEMIIYRIYADWKIVTLSLICYATGVFSYRWLVSRPFPIKENKFVESKSKLLPISLPSRIGNSYFENRYIDPPLGYVVLGGVEFRLLPKSLIFDTNEHIHYFLLRDDGSKEVEFGLPDAVNHIKSAYFLINSGNSKSIYKNQKIGEVVLLFKDAPPLVTELVLGQNIREWCPGNPGDYVRETSSPLVVMGVWTGLGKQGAIAVIDCLKIPIYECMRNNFLEKIILVHRPTQHPSDTMGVHFSVFAVSLEIDQSSM